MTKTILVADDSETMRRAVDLTFRTTDFRVVQARSADEAMAQIQAHRPDLVLADTVMPGVDGYQLCEQIKRDASLAGISVVLLASKSRPFDPHRAEAAHADAHIDKPFDTARLINQVKVLFGLPADEEVPMSFAERLAAKKRAEEAAENGTAAPSPSLMGGGMMPPSGGLEPQSAPSLGHSQAAMPMMGHDAHGMPSFGDDAPPADEVPPWMRSGPDMAAENVQAQMAPPATLSEARPGLEPPRPPDAGARGGGGMDMWALADAAEGREGQPARPMAPRSAPPMPMGAVDDLAASVPPPSAKASRPVPGAGSMGRMVDGAADFVAQQAAGQVPGLAREELLAMAKATIETIAWEVVPELAETIIREEIQRLLRERES